MPHDPDQTRRTFLQLALAAGAGGMIAGCAGTGNRTSELPGPAWPSSPDDLTADNGPPALDLPEVASPATAPSAGGRAVVLSRTSWASGKAEPGLMKRMLPVRHITVHHSAGPLFTENSKGGTVERLESIRRYHRSMDWGDIGYHYAVDRAGRIWECRSLKFQGAHVRDHNEGNLGVVALGNFDQQYPSERQLQALTAHVASLMQRYRVPMKRLRTHQEWGASTACPGRSLQQYMVRARRGASLG